MQGRELDRDAGIGADVVARAARAIAVIARRIGQVIAPASASVRAASPSMS
jgi:hypothetical protein